MGRGKEERREAKRKQRAASAAAHKHDDTSQHVEERPVCVKKKDILHSLERDIQLRILSRFRPRELCHLQRVSKGWAALTIMNELWWSHAVKVWCERVRWEILIRLQILWEETERPRSINPKLLKKDPGKWKGQYRDAFISQRERFIPAKPAKEMNAEWVQDPSVRPSSSNFEFVLSDFVSRAKTRCVHIIKVFARTQKERNPFVTEV
jgi:hypothetical protein